MKRISIYTLALALLLAPGLHTSIAQNSSGTLRGQVRDQQGGLIVGGEVSITGADNAARIVKTDDEGVFTATNLPPGTYTVRLRREGFSAYENAAVVVRAGQNTTLDIQLKIELVTEDVSVAVRDETFSTDSSNTPGSIILRGADLDMLSDDPDQLAEDLKSLTGSIEGPNGTQIFVDGFSGNRPPSKSSILEVRINTNPFNAEQDSIGFGRIEIITKAGSEKFGGQAFMNFNDESLNARNPYASNRAPYQARLYGGQVTGPLIEKKSSYFFDFERRDIDENAIINARILDPSLNSVAFTQAVVTPQRRTNFTSRFDYQLNKTNTFIGRYNILHVKSESAGIGGFSLLSRAYDVGQTEQTLQLSNTMIVSPSVLNVTRFQFIRNRREQNGDNSIPIINVQGAFTGGGSAIGLALNDTDRYELQNHTTLAHGQHTLQFGGRLRHSRITDVARQNFNGTFVFSSLEQYRQVLQGVPGARPQQFTIAGGNPRADVNQIDIGTYIQDDWRVRRNFTLSTGLRFEAQSNTSDKVDLAPRLSFAWAPGVAANKRPQTIIRGGAGIFYWRVSEELTLQSNRFNGINQQRFIVNNPDFFPIVPTTSSLAGASLPQTTYGLVGDVQTPYSMKGVISIERQIPYNLTISAVYLYGRDRHLLLSRNINAPLPGTYDPSNPASGVRPYGNVGNLFVFESTGNNISHNLLFNVRGNINKNLSITGRYGLAKVTGNTDDAFNFPANSYDLEDEYSAQPYYSTHAAVLSFLYRAPRGFTVTPILRANSAERFNITTGFDRNGDGVFTDRPAFATDLNKPGVVITPFGAFDPNPAPGQAVIPRNLGRAAGAATLSLRVSKLMGFGTIITKGNNGKEEKESRYFLLLTVQAQNLFNRRNQGQFIGNINSPLFGQANTLNGTARRFELQARFSF